MNKRATLVAIISLLLISCTVTNSLFANDGPDANPEFYSDSEWVLEFVELKTTKFFETDNEIPEVTQREYSSVFPQEETNFINIELYLEFPEADEEIDFDFNLIYYHPDGEVFWDYDYVIVIEEGSSELTYTEGCGFVSPKDWDPGVYQVEIYFEDELIEESSFEILVPVPTETPTPTNTPTVTPTPTPTIDFSASLNVGSAGLYHGPGTVYDIDYYINSDDEIHIIGSAYDCSWIKVITSGGAETGWIYFANLDYVLECSDIPTAFIPATPTSQPVAATPYVPPPGSIDLVIENNTGGSVTLVMSGPISHTFYISTGTQTITLPGGSYSYTVYGCGGDNMNGWYNFGPGDVWTWWCE